jgi:hypothetical protein
MTPPRVSIAKRAVLLVFAGQQSSFVGRREKEINSMESSQRYCGSQSTHNHPHSAPNFQSRCNLWSPRVALLRCAIMSRQRGTRQSSLLLHSWGRKCICSSCTCFGCDPAEPLKDHLAPPNTTKFGSWKARVWWAIACMHTSMKCLPAVQQVFDLGHIACIRFRG